MSVQFWEEFAPFAPYSRVFVNTQILIIQYAVQTTQLTIAISFARMSSLEEPAASYRRPPEVECQDQIWKPLLAKS
jgi:hypothetical protein